MELLIALLIILWLFGFIGGIGGDLIHFLLVVVLIIVIVKYLDGRRP